MPAKRKPPIGPEKDIASIISERAIINFIIILNLEIRRFTHTDNQNPKTKGRKYFCKRMRSDGAGIALGISIAAYNNKKFM